MHNEEVYLQQVSGLLQDLRFRCLGFDCTLMDVLPNHLQSAPKELAAAHIADQLLFSIASLDENFSAEELDRSRSWLHGTVFFLLNSHVEKQTFREIHSLFCQPQWLRSITFKYFLEPEGTALREDSAPPSLLKNNFERAVLQLLHRKALLSEPQNTYEILKGLL